MPIIRSRQQVWKTSPIDNENGLVGWWTFDDGSGLDSSGNQNNGALTGGPTSAGGIIGNALKFNGSSQYLATPATSYDLSTTRDFTFSAWINPNFSSASNTGSAVINFATDAASSRSYLRWENATLGFYVDCTTGSGSAWNTGAMSFGTGTWHLLTFTHTAANVGQFYFDGVAKSTSTPTSNPASVSGHPFFIGYGSVNSYYWNGLLDDVRVYHRRALSAAEVNSLYNQGLAALSLSPDEWEMPIMFSPPIADGGWGPLIAQKRSRFIGSGAVLS